MNRSCFSRVLLLFSFLLLLSSNGFGRKLLDVSHEDHAVNGASDQGKARVVIELDYENAGPNFNGRSSYPFPVISDDPPPPLPPPPPPPPPFGY